MIHFTVDELRSKIDLKSIDGDLLSEGFRLLMSGHHMIWSNLDNFEKESNQYCLDQGWDPETTLIYYDLPPTEEERKAQEEATRKQIEEDPDWDDIQIGYVDPQQVIVTLVPNMTKERFVEVLLKPEKLKAFL